MALAHCGRPELRQAERGAWHLARVALSVADTHLLVRAALDLTVPGIRRPDTRHRDPDRVAADCDRQPLVHLSDRARLAGAARRAPDARLNITAVFTRAPR